MQLQSRLLWTLTYRAPSAATEPVGRTRRATCMDARRFSPRQGCRVEKSRWRSGPASRSGVGAEAGCVSFGYLFFAQAKKSNSLPEGERKPWLQLLLPKPKLKPKQVQSFRPPSARERTFLCLCKERWPKESTPCLRAFRATRSRSTPLPGFFDDTSLYRRKTTCVLHVAPCGVLSVSSVAAEGAR